MNKNLPYLTVTFLKWFFITFPYRIFITCLRLVRLANNSISFTLNLRLIFTPIYGDYTFMGRLIGFVVRLFQIVLGLVLVLFLSVLALVVPLTWYVIPALIAYEYHVLVLVYLAFFYLIRLVTARDRPIKKVSRVSVGDELNAFRAAAKLEYEKLKSSMSISSELLHYSDLEYVLKKLELDTLEFEEKITNVKVDFSQLLLKSVSYARDQNTRYVEVEQVFLSALSLIPKIDVILSTFNLKLSHFEGAISWVMYDREKSAKLHFWQEDYEMPKMSGIGKGMTGRVTPFVDSVSRDFTKMAQYREFNEMTDRPEIVDAVIDLISSSNANVLLLGPAGSGKTSIVKHIAQKIVTGDTDNSTIRFKRIVSIDTAGLLAGTKTAGDISEKITKLFEELKLSGDIVLFFDEIHNLISGANSEDGSSIFSLIEPHLVNSKMQFIGATSTENFRKYIEPNGSFAHLFHIVDVPPTTDEETLSILEHVARDLENEYGIIVTYPALVEVIKLSNKLIHERVLPDKAVDILKRTASELKGKKIIDKELIRNEISEVTHVPVSSLSQDESQKLLEMGSKMKERVIGQDHAVDQISKALQRARVGIRDEGKPIASFLFVGTTGVGKTETAKALAREFFGDSSAMIRLDMSEYQQPESISKLIGDPSGKTKGVLTEAVRSKPFTLLLLDEIEKAYSSVLLTFLQVMDDGRLTDSSGFTVDFTNSIIIATSNVGTRAIQDVLSRGGTPEEVDTAALKDVHEHYAPEFLNRFTALIVFKPLSKDVVSKIALLLLEKVRKLADEKGVQLSFKPELITELVNRGYNPEWGARPMARVIEDTVESYLALKFLSQEIKMGDVVALGLEVFEQT